MNSAFCRRIIHTRTTCTFEDDDFSFGIYALGKGWTRTVLNHQQVNQLHNDKAYIEQKNKIVTQYKNVSPGHWGEFVKGIDEDIATSSKVNVIENAKPGAIVIMHFNHPESNLLEAMGKIVPQLRSKGYRFVRLEGLPLKGHHAIKK